MTFQYVEEQDNIIHDLIWILLFIAWGFDIMLIFKAIGMW
jgi:hypothetical protein